jgi:hypothetical protein
MHLARRKHSAGPSKTIAGKTAAAKPLTLAGGGHPAIKRAFGAPTKLPGTGVMHDVANVPQATQAILAAPDAARTPPVAMADPLSRNVTPRSQRAVNCKSTSKTPALTPHVTKPLSAEVQYGITPYECASNIV